MTRIARLLFICSLWASSATHAEWAGDFNGCSVELPHPSRYVIWDGQCKGGKATGQGIARAANATLIEGEFRKGSPYNASGQFMVELPDGTRGMVRVSYVHGKQTVAPLFDMAGRTRIDMSPLAGYWDWEMSEGKCKEKHEYHLSGDVIVRSGELRVDQLAQLYAVDGKPGWMEMVTATIGQDGNRDCKGNKLDHVGDNERFFLRIDDQQKLWRCAAAEQSSCTAAAIRGAPDPPKERNLITSSAGRINTARGFGGGAGTLGARTPGSEPNKAREQIEIVFDRNKGALYALYGRALRDNPKLEGTFVVEIDIDTAGQVTECRVKSSELNDPELEKKLVARIRLIQFGALEKAMTVMKSIDFFPAA